MIDKLLKIIAPHHCINCNQIGSTLCDSCKDYIVNETFAGCIVCLKPSNGICKNCKPPYTRAWCVSSLENPVKDLLYNYKFESKRDSARILAELVNKVVDYLPEDTIVTYIPTLSSHMRARGFDHARLIAKNFASIRKLKFKSTLRRVTKSHQRDASAKQRWQQAKVAYEATLNNQGKTYLLIDDIVTTGATIEHAAKCLIKNGAEEVWVAAIARQTLD